MYAADVTPSPVPGSPKSTALQREHLLPGAGRRPSLLLREQPPVNRDRSQPVLYLHGSTFPSALSIMFRFEGRSWADSLNDAGYDVFGLDFAGYGGSQRYDWATSSGRTVDVADQVVRAVDFILRETGGARVSVIAHSWGTMAAGLFAGDHPDLVDKLVLFGPIAGRPGPSPAEVVAPYLDVTVEAQHARFVADVPAMEPPVLIEDDFPHWGGAYLDSDSASRTRNPAAVRVPAGPVLDIAEAWSGHMPYDPSRIRAPTLIVRGAWDSVTQDADAAWFNDVLVRSASVRHVVVPRATHLMHLEQGRSELYAATNAFLTSDA